MAQAQIHKWTWIKVQIPNYWKPILEKLAHEKGYKTIAELVRDLIREKVIEGGQ
jgi:metal-responsive CopG/Arc/MetJ family transcriptional regulator